MRRPVPPPFLTWRGGGRGAGGGGGGGGGGREKEKLLESAAGVAESSELIQVSVRHKMLSAVWEAIAGIRSALLTAD